MLLQILKSKIHRVTTAEAHLHYSGSITIDSALMKAAGLYAGEKVLVVNINNGNRLETYAIPGEEGSGKIGLNGAAAHLFGVGDVAIIMSFALMTEQEAAEYKPKLVFPDTATNQLV